MHYYRCRLNLTTAKFSLNWLIQISLLLILLCWSGLSHMNKSFYTYFSQHFHLFSLNIIDHLASLFHSLTKFNQSLLCLLLVFYPSLITLSFLAITWSIAAKINSVRALSYYSTFNLSFRKLQTTIYHAIIAVP